MLRPTYSLTLLTLLTATTLAACTADKNETDTAASGTTGASTGAVTDATDASASGSTSGSATDAATDTTPTSTTTGGDTAADGEACSANGDCMSVACLKYRDAEEGECVAAEPNMTTRITGTLLDFVTGAPLPGLELRVVGALSALGDPANAAAVAKGTSAADGKVDFVSAEALKEGIAIIGLVGGGGGDYYITATGLASQTAGKYGPMSSIRDIWAVPSAKLTEWSGLLAADAEVMSFLPLGDKGGVIGLLRDATTSAPKAGAKVLPVSDTSTALIRYLSDDGTSFNSNASGTNGIFLVINPGFAEEFTVEGYPEITAKGGSAPGAAFITVFNLP